MKNEPQKCRRAFAAFTLIELLVVIAIIGILASLLLPAIARAKTAAKVATTKSEMASLNAAISQYKSDYSLLPASTAAYAKAANNVDFTFGTFVKNTSVNGTVVPSPLEGTNIVSSSAVLGQTGIFTQPLPGYQNVNSEVISILNDYAYYPETNVTRHTYNSRSTSGYQARTTTDTTSPGIDPNYILRDPWGMPYIITLDLNGDGKCVDAIWSQPPSSGIVIGNASFSVPGDSMIWSFGPLKVIDLREVANCYTNNSVVKSWK